MCPVRFPDSVRLGVPVGSFVFITSILASKLLSGLHLDPNTKDLGSRNTVPPNRACGTPTARPQASRLAPGDLRLESERKRLLRRSRAKHPAWFLDGSRDERRSKALAVWTFTGILDRASYSIDFGSLAPSLPAEHRRFGTLR